LPVLLCHGPDAIITSIDYIDRLHAIIPTYLIDHVPEVTTFGNYIIIYTYASSSLHIRKRMRVCPSSLNSRCTVYWNFLGLSERDEETVNSEERRIERIHNQTVEACPCGVRCGTFYCFLQVQCCCQVPRVRTWQRVMVS
jgi:hypothetical protein